MAERSGFSKHEPRWSRIFAAIDYVEAWSARFCDGQATLSMHYNSHE